MIRASAQGLTEVSTTAKHKLGTLYSTNGKIYIYMLGVASTGAGSFVSFDEAFATTLLAANAIGKVAVAMAATVASRYGWYQIYGVSTTAKTDTVAAGTQAYIDGTAGRVDDAVVTGDMVLGCTIESADATNVATVSLAFPFVTDALG